MDAEIINTVIDLIDKGFSVFTVIKGLFENHVDIEKTIQGAFIKAFYEMANKLWPGERILENVLKDAVTQTKLEDMLSSNLSEKTVRELILKVCGEDRSNNLTDDFFEIFMESYERACSEDAKIVYYLTIKKMRNENKKHIISQQEYDGLIEYINVDVKDNRKCDMYNKVSYVLDTLYPYCIDNLKKGCSKNVINLGYDLTDILEHIGEFDKAIKLAKAIYKLMKEQENINEDIGWEDAQKYIGCAYTFVIARPKNTDDREKLLDMGKELLDHCKCILDSRLTEWPWPQQLFLLGLFHSDYAAYLLNRGQMAEACSEDGYENYYKEALKEHEKSRDYRKECVKVDSDKDSAVRRVIQSESNIAYCREYLRQYDTAIEEYEEVLKKWDGKNEITRSFLTKRYIVRTYLKKAEEGALMGDQKDHCLMYIQECLKYYKEVKDVRAYKQVMEMEMQLRGIQGADSVDKK